MQGDVGFEDHVDYDQPHFPQIFFVEIAEEVPFGIEHYAEGGRAVVVFEGRVVVVADGFGVFGSDDELVGDSRVFEVMYVGGDEGN